MPDRLRYPIIETDNAGLPSEYTTACTVPATVRRHVDTTAAVPRIETDQVCADHWLLMYCCQSCGNDKGTWRGAFCRPCLAAIEDALCTSPPTEVL